MYLALMIMDGEEAVCVFLWVILISIWHSIWGTEKLFGEGSSPFNIG
jgi:hypothetical protein